MFDPCWEVIPFALLPLPTGFTATDMFSQQQPSYNKQAPAAVFCRMDRVDSIEEKAHGRIVSLRGRGRRIGLGRIIFVRLAGTTIFYHADVSDGTSCPLPHLYLPTLPHLPYTTLPHLGGEITLRRNDAFLCFCRIKHYRITTPVGRAPRTPHHACATPPLHAYLFTFSAPRLHSFSPLPSYTCLPHTRHSRYLRCTLGQHVVGVDAFIVFTLPLLPGWDAPSGRRLPMDSCCHRHLPPPCHHYLNTHTHTHTFVVSHSHSPNIPPPPPPPPVFILFIHCSIDDPAWRTGAPFPLQVTVAGGETNIWGVTSVDLPTHLSTPLPPLPTLPTHTAPHTPRTPPPLPHFLPPAHHPAPPPHPHTPHTTPHTIFTPLPLRKT